MARERIHGIVVAGNNRQFIEWCRIGRVRPIDYFYVYPGRHLYGFHAIPVFFVGEYWKNDMYNHPHIREIIWEFQMWAKKNFAGC